MVERIRHMLVKEFILLLRDPRMRAITFGVPILQVIVFGYAATTDVRHVRLGVYDLDNSAESRALVARFVTSSYFDVVEHVDDDGRVRALLDRGAVEAVLRLNRGFAEDLAAGRTAEVQVIVDGTDATSAGIVLSYSAGIVRQYSEAALTALLSRLPGPTREAGRVQLESRAWFNESLQSRHFYIPGIIANIILITTLLLTSMAVVREKELGTMEQVMVTPITRLEFILGKTVPFALVGFADVVLVTVVGVVWFRVPVRCGPPLLLLATGLFLMTTLGVGLLISTVSRTQQQAMMTTFFFAFPAILLSGFMFPIANMPRAVQALTYLDPLRYFVVILRGLFLKGLGLGVLWPQFLALALMGIITLWAASRRFRKTVA